jgi:hypothetical protein
MGENLYNYREEYIRSKLFYASKIWEKSEFQDDAEVQAFGSAYRSYNFSKFLYKAFLLGSLTGLNVFYVVPRMNKLGGFAAVLANVSLFGSL